MMYVWLSQVFALDADAHACHNCEHDESVEKNGAKKWRKLKLIFGTLYKTDYNVTFTCKLQTSVLDCYTQLMTFSTLLCRRAAKIQNRSVLLAVKNLFASFYAQEKNTIPKGRRMMIGVYAISQLEIPVHVPQVYYSNSIYPYFHQYMIPV